MVVLEWNPVVPLWEVRLEASAGVQLMLLLFPYNHRLHVAEGLVLS
jgi:hypothetical protein